MVCIWDRKKRARSGSGTPSASDTDASASRSRVNWSDSVASQTTSSHTFFPRASRMGREQKSSSHSRIASGSASGSR
nr:unnamed protein product [Digitaria exilis]